MELRALTFLDVLQPQLTGFLQTVASGFQPLEGQAALFVEIAPGIAINRVTDAALKHTACIPSMQIVERAYGLVALQHFDQGQVRAAAEAILREMGCREEDRIAPKLLSSEAITGLDGHQAMLINRMRHGDMIAQGQTLYVMEVCPAAYAAIASNEAEKAAPIHVLEMVAFGAFGRLYLGGSEEEITQAVAAIQRCLGAITGRAQPARGD